MNITALEKGRISHFQLRALVIGFILGSAILIPPGQKAGHDAWIAVLLGLLESLFFAAAFLTLAVRFRGKTFVEISDAVYGRYFGTVVSFVFILYMFHLCALVLDAYTGFINAMLLPETPRYISTILLVLVCAAAVRNGVEVIARCSQVLVPATILLVMLVLLMQLGDFDLHHFQPVLEAPPGRLLFAAHAAASFPFAETVAFLMVIPFLGNIRKAPSALVQGLLIGGITVFAVIIRNTAILGQTASLYNTASFEAVRRINIAGFLNRLELIVAVNLMTTGFLQLCVFYYGSVLGMAQILHMRSYRPLVLPLGVLIVILALIGFKNSVEHSEFSLQIWPFWAIPFELVIPLLTLLIAYIRKIPKEGS